MIVADQAFAASVENNLWVQNVPCPRFHLEVSLKIVPMFPAKKLSSVHLLVGAATRSGAPVTSDNSP